MFALVTRVQLPEGGTMEEGRQELETTVLPMIKQAPGFVSAVFVPTEGNVGLSIIVFQTREQAEMAQQMQRLPERLALIGNEVSEVAAIA